MEQHLGNSLEISAKLCTHTSWHLNSKYLFLEGIEVVRLQKDLKVKFSVNKILWVMKSRDENISKSEFLAKQTEFWAGAWSGSVWMSYE